MNTQFTRRAFQLFIVITIVLAGCKNRTLSSRAVLQALPPSPNVAVAREIRIPLDTLHPAYAGLSSKKNIAAFYQQRDAQPAWSSGGISTPQADTLIGFLKRTAYYGLPVWAYHNLELASLMPDSSILVRQRFDLATTNAYLELSHDLAHGRRMPYAPSRTDSASFEKLRKVLLRGGVVSSLQANEPPYPAYHALKECLKTILDSAAAGLGDTVLQHQKIQKIAINIQRWRNESPQGWAPRHLIVNVPAFRLDVIDNGDTVLSSRVIVGTPSNPTPELSSIIRTITLFPYWVVPRKIAIEEYLPLIRKDTTFFAQTDFEVLDRSGNLLDPGEVAWNTFHKNNFPVTLRQREGTGNALGIIKFSFDNPYAIYLHDTNAPRLFRKNTRAFSHGCIRVEKAAALARYLLTDSPAGQSLLMNKYINERRQAVLAVPRPLPVYVRYFTAEVTQGVLSIRPDIYRRDMPLSEQIKAWQL